MYKVKQVIIIRKDLNMRRGKQIAQGSHASMKVFFDRMGLNDASNLPHFHGDYYCDFTPAMIEWKEGSFAKIVVSCNSEEELFALKKQADVAGIVNAIILDNGSTEFKEVCPTCEGEGRFTDGDAIDEFCNVCNGTGKINKPTYTALAIGPDESSKIDPITKDLPLL